MPAAKPTISLETAAASAGVSFSAWLAEAARQRLRRERLLGLIAEWEDEHGAFTDEERAEARAELGIGRRSAKSA
jgi:hypothetical protein